MTVIWAERALLPERLGREGAGRDRGRRPDRGGRAWRGRGGPAGRAPAAGAGERPFARLPARHGRALRGARAASARHLLDLAADHVPLPRPSDARGRRGDRQPRADGDAGGGLRHQRRVPLPPPPARRRALRQCRRDGRAHRRRGGPHRHRPDAPAGALPVRRPRPPPARARSAALRHRPRRLRPPARRRRGGAPPPAARRRHRRGAAFAARRQPRGAGACAKRCGPTGPLHMHLAEQIPEVEEVRGRHRPPPGRVAARQPRARPPLDADPPDPHDRGRDPPPRGDRRGRRPLPDHRVEPRRRHLQRHGLEGRRRPARLRLRQQHPHRPRRGAAHPRIQPAPARHRARHPRRAGAVDRAGALRGGARWRGDGGGARDRGDPGGLWADLCAVSRANPVLAGRDGDAMLDSLVFAGGDGLVREVWAAGRHVVREGRHVERDRIVAEYLACIAGLEQRM